jgi:hypothetical protein
MGLFGRLLGPPRARLFFLKKDHALKTALEPPKGRPFWGGNVHRILGDGGMSASLCNSFIACVTRLNSEEHTKPDI